MRYHHLVILPQTPFVGIYKDHVDRALLLRQVFRQQLQGIAYMQPDLLLDSGHLQMTSYRNLIFLVHLKGMKHSSLLHSPSYAYR